MACALVQALAACGGGHSTPTPPASDAMHEAATQLQSGPTSNLPASTGGSSTGGSSTGGPSTGGTSTGGSSTGGTSTGGTSTGDTPPGGNAKGAPSIEEQNSYPEPYEQDPPRHSTAQDNSVKVPTDASEPTQQINAAVSRWTSAYSGAVTLRDAAHPNQKRWISLVFWGMPDGNIHGYTNGDCFGEGKNRLHFSGAVEPDSSDAKFELLTVSGKSYGHVELEFRKLQDGRPYLSATLNIPERQRTYQVVLTPIHAMPLSDMGYTVHVKDFRIQDPGLNGNRGYGRVSMRIRPGEPSGTLVLRGQAVAKGEVTDQTMSIKVNATLPDGTVEGFVNGAHGRLPFSGHVDPNDLNVRCALEAEPGQSVGEIGLAFHPYSNVPTVDASIKYLNEDEQVEYTLNAIKPGIWPQRGDLAKDVRYYAGGAVDPGDYPLGDISVEVDKERDTVNLEGRIGRVTRRLAKNNSSQYTDIQQWAMLSAHLTPVPDVPGLYSAEVTSTADSHPGSLRHFPRQSVSSNCHAILWQNGSPAPLLVLTCAETHMSVYFQGSVLKKRH